MAYPIVKLNRSGVGWEGETKMEIKVKPFWQSVSFWMTIATILGLVLDKLVAGGVLPNEGWVTIAITVVGLITKRGMTENTAIKANALASVDPSKPPA